MKNKILSMLAILAVAVNMVGCAPPNSAAPVEATEQIVVETTAEAAETSSPTSSENTQLITEFEITDWTMEELVSDMVVDNHTFSLPCSLNEINTDYKIDTVYFEDIQKTSGTILNNDKEIAIIGFNGNVADDAGDAEIKYLFLGGSYELPAFNIMGITEKSSYSDVINILGNPNMRVEYSNEVLQYGFTKDKYILIWFDEESDNIFHIQIIYNTED